MLMANSGETALAQSQDTPGNIDLLISNLGIPDMSGREVWEAVKTAHPESRVMFISGYPEDFLPLEDISDGFFLQKPFGPDTLLRRLREILD